MLRARDVVRAAVDLGSTMLVMVLAAPMWFAPLPAAVVLGRFGGLVGFLFWGRARRAGMINLRRAYGTPMSRAQARETVRDVFANLGQSIAEGIHFARVGPERFGPAFTIENEELARSIREDPRPKIFVTAHLGSWEVALMTVRDVSGIEGSVIARGVDNPFLNRLVRRVRFRSSDEWIDKFGASEAALERLRAGCSVAMLLDENGGPRGPFVPFFGRDASTRKTAALLSAMTGAPIVVGVAVRRGDGLLLRLERMEPPGNTSREAIVDVTARISTCLERWIRQDPLQWRWIHWRWRSRPDGSEETYTRSDVERCFRGGEVVAPTSVRVEEPR